MGKKKKRDLVISVNTNDIVSLKCNLQQKNKQGLGALELASKVGTTECIQVLLDSGLTFKDYSAESIKFLPYKPGGSNLFPQVEWGTLDALILHSISPDFTGTSFQKSTNT